MADTADDRNFAGGDRPRDGFLVERPQVFDASAAAADDQHVTFRTTVGDRNGCSNLFRTACSLHRRGIQHHGHAGKALSQGGEHIAQCSSLRRGDNADAARKSRQGTLAICREQSLAFQQLFKPLESFIQYAQPGRAHLFNRQLKVAALLIQSGDRQHFNLLAAGDRLFQQLVFMTEHHAADLRLIVFQ